VAGSSDQPAHEGVTVGVEMHRLVSEMFPLCRSITGLGLRRSLAIIARELPAVQLHEVATGTRVFDWTIPQEWSIREAWLEDPAGDRIVDFSANNLHVVSYSSSIDRSISLEELQAHLHSLPERPEAIPYVTSYYHEDWGLCLRHSLRSSLKPGIYRVRIDSSLAPGSLTFGEAYIPGRSKDEILISTYVCHPSMANNELSGPAVATFIGKWLAAKASRRFSYRLVFVPETIGTLAFLSRNLAHLRRHVRAGFVLTCIGDDRAYSYLASRHGRTLADRTARHVLSHLAPGHRSYDYLQRGSDERQYCFPGIDLPVCSLMRSKYGTFPEYHTSDDDLHLVTPGGLQGGFELVRRCIETLEANETFVATTIGEPQLGKYGLYPRLGGKDVSSKVRLALNLLAHSDGTSDLLTLADRFGVETRFLRQIADELVKHGLLRSQAGDLEAIDHLSAP
jgi:aminopeptidase-like protein